MCDIDKTIKGLECCIDGSSCKKCPYAINNDSTLGCTYRLEVDAITLLKAQEPKAIMNVAEVIDDILCGECPNCHKTIVEHKNGPTRFCKFCGQAVKWND